jgi:putative FmdB family regulatory protein
MPTYDYVCDACGHEFEHFQSMSSPVERKCPKCKKLKLRRLIGTGLAIMFKGSGFYTTDYRSEQYKKHAAADKPSESSEKKPESKTETKSETKSESKSETKSESKSSSKKSSGGKHGKH